MRGLTDDLCDALRTISRRPGTTVVAVLILTFGIGVTTTIFSVVDAVLLRPLPYIDSDRLVVIWQSDRTRNQPFIEISYPAFREWRERTRLFESIAAMPSVNFEMALTGRGEPVAIEGRAVTADFFSLLGTEAALGRVLLPQDDEIGAPSVAVLSNGLWRERFNSDPELVGKSMVLDGRPFTIVGVMPERFRYPRGARFWIPLQLPLEARQDDGLQWMLGLGRVKVGVELDAARSELTQLWRQRYRRLAPEGADTSLLEGYTVVLTPLAGAIFGHARAALVAIFGAGILVLLIACANSMGLLLVEATDRRRDIAIRYALGGKGARLVRSMLAQGALIAVVAGAGGLALAWGGIPFAIAQSPLDVPRLHEAAINIRAFVFALLAAAVAAALSALGPMVMVRDSRLEPLLRQSTPRMTPGGGRVRTALVVAQIAVSLVLLVGAGLLTRTFLNLRQAPLGFEPGHVLAVTVSPTGEKYADIGRGRAFYREILDRVRALPGVASVGAATRRPLWSTVGYDWGFTLEGQTEKDARRNPLVNLMAVSSDYFRTMGIAVKRGRVFSDSDAEDRPGVVVVSESLAARSWPGADPIGKRIKIPLPDTPYHDTWLTVVGVVADARYREIQAARLDLYMSYLQSNHPLNNLMVRTYTDPALLSGAIVGVIHDIDPYLPVTETTSMSRIVHQALGIPRFATQLFSAFALAAIALAAFGVHALLAFWVASRTREMSVRRALGAQARDIWQLVFGQVFGLTCIGLTLGLIAAALGGRLLGSLLYEVNPHDPITYSAHHYRWRSGRRVPVAYNAGYSRGSRGRVTRRVVGLRTKPSAQVRSCEEHLRALPLSKCWIERFLSSSG
jgi:putative ABC transport system permease protein